MVQRRLYRRQRAISAPGWRSPFQCRGDTYDSDFTRTQQCPCQLWGRLGQHDFQCYTSRSYYTKYHEKHQYLWYNAHPFIRRNIANPTSVSSLVAEKGCKDG